jgi:hypothetical protein
VGHSAPDDDDYLPGGTPFGGYNLLATIAFGAERVTCATNQNAVSSSGVTAIKFRQITEAAKGPRGRRLLGVVAVSR